jgi:putative Ca2+/H+ antiporter (TMEM165/GDT1 family)
MRELMIIFATVFVAELGDKTQLATLVFAAEGKSNPLAVFLAAAAALVVGTGLSVLMGWMGSRYLDHVPVKLIAGLLFIAIGLWTVVQHFRGA